jgi:hypothetical protein
MTFGHAIWIKWIFILLKWVEFELDFYQNLGKFTPFLGERLCINISFNDLINTHKWHQSSSRLEGSSPQFGLEIEKDLCVKLN